MPGWETSGTLSEMTMYIARVPQTVTDLLNCALARLVSKQGFSWAAKLPGDRLYFMLVLLLRVAWSSNACLIVRRLLLVYVLDMKCRGVLPLGASYVFSRGLRPLLNIKTMGKPLF